jgi:Na+/H+ antiporter NhaC
MDSFRRTIWFILFLFLGEGLFAQSSEIFNKDDFEVEMPHLIVEGVTSNAALVCTDLDKLYLLDGKVETIVNGERVELIFDKDRAVVPMVFDRNEPMSLKVGGFTYVHEVTPMPIWLSIVPPLLVILLALVFKEVISSLLAGIVLGAALVAYYSTESIGIFRGMLSALDKYIVSAMTDSGHVSVILFSTIIGGIVAVISKNGGMQAVVDKISRRANSARSGQLATWFLGVGIFFDDYANTLVVGNTMRPLTDRLKISREKLSYIVDSTAAPIAAIALITTWIGAELGYIQSALDQINSTQINIDSNPYLIFLGSLKYSFYPVFALGFMLFLILRNRDFGPMYDAEIMARSGNKITSETGDKVDLEALDEFQPDEGVKFNMWNALIPIIAVVLGTVAGMLYTGAKASGSELIENDLPVGRMLSIIVGNSDSYQALLWASTLGLVVAILLSVFQKTLSFSRAITVSVDGFKTMLMAIVIIILAWSLGAVTEEMHTANFLADLAKGNLAVWAIPAVTFVLSAAVAFSTGSSWGTMAIIYPIMLPLSWVLCMEVQMDMPEAMEIFLNTTSCVLAGAVLGDHCSPISDTTILSSLATRCDHIQHVRTQLPYALTVGGVAILFTTISALFSPPWILSFLVGLGVLFLIVNFIGKPVPEN